MLILPLGEIARLRSLLPTFRLSDWRAGCVLLLFC